MKFDKYILLFFLFICFISISNVSAVYEINGGSLNDLDTAIKISNGNVILSDDIITNDNESITINGTAHIDGNNHKLYSDSNTTLFDVNGSLTLSNLEIFSISCLFVHIHPSASVVLDNVTFTNATISHNCLVYNEGNLTVINSNLIHCISDKNIPLFYSTTNSNTLFNNFIFEENYALIIHTANNSLLKISNSKFIANNAEYINYCNYTPNRYMIKSSSKTNILHSEFFANSYYSIISLDESSNITESSFTSNNYHLIHTIYKKSLIESSNGINISGCNFDQDGGESVILINNGSYEIKSNRFVNNNISEAIIVDNTKSNSSILYLNLFLGCSSKNPALIYNNTGTFRNNYYGSNTPYEDGIIQSGNAGENQSYYILVMNVIDNEDHNLSSLSPCEEVSIKFYLKCGDDGEELNINPIVFTSLNKKVKFGSTKNMDFLTPPGDIGISYMMNNNVKETFYPTRWGNETIIIGSNFLSPLFTFNISINYFELKNYTMKTTITDNIKYGENLSIAVEIKDADNLPINGISEIFVDGDFIEIMQIINGTGNLTVNNLNTGNHTLNISYCNYDIYNDIYEFRNITVSKADLNLTISVSDIAIGKDGIILLSNIPKDLAHNISMIIDDIIEQGGEILSVNGSAEQIFTNLTLGEKSVLIYYPGDDNYNEFRTYAFFKVLTDYIKTDDIADIPDIIDIIDEFNGSDENISNESNMNEDIEDDLSIVDVFEDETNSHSDFIDIDEYFELDDVQDNDFENTTDISSFEDTKPSDSNKITLLEDNIADNINILLSDSEIIINDIMQNTMNNPDNLNTTDDNSIGDKITTEKDSTSKETSSSSKNTDKSTSAKAYEVDKVTKQINNNLIPSVLFIISIIVLIFIGYKRQKKQ